MRKSKKLLSSAAVVEKSYKINDRRGTDKHISSPYPTPSNNNNYRSYRPRLTVVGDTPKIITPYDRLDQILFARSLFSSMPDLGGALLSKANWCVGSAFSPIYTGKKKEWGEEVEYWLEDQWYPVCNVLGQNYDLRTTLYLSSLGIDVDGSSGLLLTTNRSGYPQVQLIPAHRIGCRGNEQIVKEGKFAGYRIFDGVIVNDGGRPIAYRILGDTKDDDADISATSLQLLFEPEWSDQIQGISRIARSVLDWLDSQDIDEYTKRGVKIASSVGLIHTTETGQADVGTNILGATEDSTLPVGNNNLTMEYIKGGEVYYLKANAGEDIKTIFDQRPSTNTEAFMARIQRRALYACGWPVELLDPSKLNGGAVRLIQDLARKSITSRQITLERRAKWMINFAVAKAMNAGIIPQNNEDWYSWSFTKGSQIQVDLGNEENAQREAYKLGTTTLSDIASKKGMDWTELREQQQRETEDLLNRATELSKKYNIPLEAALTLLSQRTPNSMVSLDNTPVNKE